jgi:hypothetical protein
MRIWRDEDDYALRRMAPDGMAITSYALGRKLSEVLIRADVLGVSFPDDWRKSPSEGATMPLEDATEPTDERVMLELHAGLVCPRCGKGTVLPSSKAGRMFGVCEACYHRSAAIVAANIAAENEARREHDAARKRMQRSKARR